MSTVDDARDGADAVRKFAAEVGRGSRTAQRIQVKLAGGDGMATLCAVEAVMSDLWPATTAKELMWLGRSGLHGGDQLHFEAFGANGERVCDATFRLARRSA